MHKKTRKAQNILTKHSQQTKHKNTQKTIQTTQNKTNTYKTQQKETT